MRRRGLSVGTLALVALLTPGGCVMDDEPIDGAYVQTLAEPLGEMSAVVIPDFKANEDFGSIAMVTVDSPEGVIVHAAAVGSKDGIPALYYITNKTGAWRKRLLYTDSVWAPTDPTIALGGSERPTIVYAQSEVGATPGNIRGLYMHRNVKLYAKRVGSGTKVAGRQANAPSLAIDGERIHLAYEKGGNTPGLDQLLTTKVFYVSVSSDFANPRVWRDNKVLVAGNLSYTGTALSLGSNGKARILYSTPDGLQFRAARRKDSINGLGAVKVVPRTRGAYPDALDLEIAGKTIHVGFYKNGEVRSITRGEDLTWGDVKPVTDNGAYQFDMDMTTDTFEPIFATAAIEGDNRIRFHTPNDLGGYHWERIANMEIFQNIELDVTPSNIATMMFVDYGKGGLIRVASTGDLK